LPIHHPSSQHEGADRDEQQKLAEIDSSSQSSISDKALTKSAEHERQRLCYQRGHHAKPAILPSACLQIPSKVKKERHRAGRGLQTPSTRTRLASPSEYVQRKPDKRLLKLCHELKYECRRRPAMTVVNSGSAGRSSRIRSASLQSLTILEREIRCTFSDSDPDDQTRSKPHGKSSDAKATRHSSPRRGP